MNYYALVGFFNGLMALAVGFYILSKNPSSQLFCSFFIFSTIVGLWAIFYAIWQIQEEREYALFFIRLSLIFSYFIPSAFLWFCISLVGLKKRKLFFALLIIPAIFVPFSFTRALISDVKAVLSFPFWPQPGFLMHFFIFSFFAGAILAFWILFRAFKQTQGMHRRQIKWVALIMLPGWIGGSTTWPLWYGLPIAPIPNFFVGISFLCLGYIVIRDKLFDIDILADIIQETKLTALGIIAASINHEIRNPLYVIKGLAEMLAERVSDPSANKEQVFDKAKEIADKTIAQSDRALQIIKSFSAYARRETDKVYEKQRVRVKEVLEHILPFAESELNLKKIMISQNIPEGLEVFVDVQSLEEIFINLIVNACQAMAEGGEIVISAKEEKPWLIIKIRDTGPGLAPEQLSRIFEPFYTTKASGTGLGLYIVKQLVEKNGGRVEVASKIGDGTTFTILFP